MNGNRSERAYNLRWRGASWGEVALACEYRCAAEAHRVARTYAEDHGKPWPIPREAALAARIPPEDRQPYLQGQTDERARIVALLLDISDNHKHVDVQIAIASAAMQIKLTAGNL